MIDHQLAHRTMPRHIIRIVRPLPDFTSSPLIEVAYSRMGLFQLWVAVGDEYHFQRVVNGLTADVYRSETGWAFIVREGANLIEQGRTSTWDEAVERAQTAAEASKVMSAVHNEYMQTYQDEQAALSSSW